MADERELMSNEIKLSDGRIVAMRESTGADDIAVARMLGDKVSLQGAGQTILMQANALKCIESIDNQPAPIMNNYETFVNLARQFKTKDMNKILLKYAEMNFEANPDNPLA
ncbi:hypothetical protein [Alicyclobacillus acidoterrestris]|uniref:Uncharacterized protein n=1 Tax=Alicyclobacillus acidoterrestris (strain ATCC 49025 / DSM 3922 / CIP 106132 / NCIMB 13137 / GD3B) TaxID=1356854 RepID=T0D809_ALIAG|nr:hypothetical protein [Alicyclobacillus acidoterrestris]EPZ47632.1 hypothetical protein N007_05080 [Alicyclobacillus acidoterrestris ATCC 49025]UNO48048.1 hypothetical protein K1I37_15350 [Alicyclobacillus acidoterrestris]